MATVTSVILRAKMNMSQLTIFPTSITVAIICNISGTLATIAVKNPLNEFDLYRFHNHPNAHTLRMYLCCSTNYLRSGALTSFFVFDSQQRNRSYIRPFVPPVFHSVAVYVILIEII